MVLPVMGISQFSEFSDVILHLHSRPLQETPLHFFLLFAANPIWKLKVKGFCIWIWYRKQFVFMFRRSYKNRFHVHAFVIWFRSLHVGHIIYCVFRFVNRFHVNFFVMISIVMCVFRIFVRISCFISCVSVYISVFVLSACPLIFFFWQSFSSFPLPFFIILTAYLLPSVPINNHFFKISFDNYSFMI